MKDINNLDLYNQLSAVPEWAQDIIEGGALRGLTSINPIWRIEALTLMFGPCGVGWRVEIADQKTDVYNSGIMITIRLNLYYKQDEEWSEAVTGYGSFFMAKPDDQAYKKAFTEALGQCTKLLGLGAEIYKEGKKPDYSGLNKGGENNGAKE